MSLLTGGSVRSFLSDVRSAPQAPHVQLRNSTATKIQTRFGASDGNKKERIYIPGLTDERFKIAAFSPLQNRPLFDNYLVTHVTVNDQPMRIWINTRSAMKRFDLPKDVIVNNLSNFNRIVRLVQEKQLFLNPDEDSEPSDGPGTALVPLLPLERAFGPLIPLEKIAILARENNRCYRLSKRCYNLARSIDIYPDGFIAFATGQLIGEGGYVKVKMSVTRDNMRLARRCYKFNLLDPSHDNAVINIINIFNEFRNKIGILNTLATGVYENKNGKCKFVSFHPFYDQAFDGAHVHTLNLSAADRLKMAHELLQGLNTLAEKGLHRDLSYANIFHSSTAPFEAVIGNLENFKYHGESVVQTLNPFYGPEQHGTKREVWDLGKVIYYLFSSTFKRLSWDGSLKHCTNESLDRVMESSRFSPAREQLLRGMLAPNPTERWTANQALEYFEKHCQEKIGSSN